MAARFAFTALPFLSGAIAEYSEEQATSNIYLSVSAYCGEPKFNNSFLQDWSCGPSCEKAGKVTEIDQFDYNAGGIFGFTGHFDEHCILVFRGTSTGDGWKSDLDSSLVDLNNSGCSGCKVEQGFNKGYIAVQATIQSALARYGCKDLTITGHSLGAALATLATYDLGSKYTIKETYNFGSPRVGNPAFATSYDSKFPTTYRVTHYKDPIPHGPTLGMGFYHVTNEIYYHNTTSEGFKTCQGAEDKSCADQFGGNLFADLALAACCADDHLVYMQNTVTVPTDGGSCAHVALSTAVEHAYITTAAYCSPESLRKWDCGAPCDNVKGGVSGVQVIDVPFESMSAKKTVKGNVRGFVGHVHGKCVLSLTELFSIEDGLAMIKEAGKDDLVDLESNLDLGKNCTGCKAYKVLQDAYAAAKGPLLKALEQAGCTKDMSSSSGRRLMIVGHGLGSALGFLVAYHLKDGTGYTPGTFGIEPSFAFGAPRCGNKAFVDAFRHKMGDDLFRVTYHKDPYLYYPKHEHGFVHMDQELFFDGEAAWDTSSTSSYARCPVNGENTHCAQRHAGSPGPLYDHTRYMQPLVEVDMGAMACKSDILWT